ncbi:hypothetical protein C8R45DRAFT_924178 [Mycena sanguinolenta]|nr:hypothetical protein C8R45DRAFT_924178 [Mycena sanguinolenta]
MGDRNSLSGRRKSRRIAKVDAQSPVAEPDALQLSSPDHNTMSVGDPNLQVSPSAQFSMLPQNHTPSLEDQDSSSSIMITPAPLVKRKAPTKAQKEAAKKATKKAAKRAVAETAALSDDTLGSDSDDAIAPPPKRRKKDKGKEPAILCDDQRRLAAESGCISMPYKVDMATSAGISLYQGASGCTGSISANGQIMGDKELSGLISSRSKGISNTLFQYGNRATTAVSAPVSTAVQKPDGPIRPYAGICALVNGFGILRHTTMGCTDVARKPVLTYKLSNAVKSVPETSLQTDSDWKGCLQDVRQAERTKKAGTVIPVMILVTEQASFCNHARQDKIAERKGVKQEGAGVGFGPCGELKFVEELDTHYSHCQACGPTKICKITVAGTHHHLSNNQRRAWSQALALKKNGVTLRTPPRDVAGQNLFGMFFKSVVSEAVRPVPGPPMQNLLSTMIPPQTMGYPYMPWPLPGYSHMPSMEAMHPIASAAAPSHAPHASTSALPAVLPSSDPPEMGALNPYPEIPDFLRRLDGYEPRRNILDYIPTFAALDYYNIDEIHRLGTVEQLVLVAKITHGNATYLMAQVKNEIKRVDRCRKTLF